MKRLLRLVSHVPVCLLLIFGIPMVSAQEDRPQLGVRTHQPPEARHPSGGFVVDEVLRASPADVAGIHVGDRILKLNGVDTPDSEVLVAELSRRKVGDEVVLAVRRGTESMLQVTARLGSTNAYARRTEDANVFKAFLRIDGVREGGRLSKLGFSPRRDWVVYLVEVNGKRFEPLSGAYESDMSSARSRAKSNAELHALLQRESDADPLTLKLFYTGERAAESPTCAAELFADALYEVTLDGWDVSLLYPVEPWPLDKAIVGLPVYDASKARFRDLRFGSLVTYTESDLQQLSASRPSATLEIAAGQSSSSKSTEAGSLTKSEPSRESPKDTMPSDPHDETGAVGSLSADRPTITGTGQVLSLPEGDFIIITHSFRRKLTHIRATANGEYVYTAGEPGQSVVGGVSFGSHDWFKNKRGQSLPAPSVNGIDRLVIESDQCVIIVEDFSK